MPGPCIGQASAWTSGLTSCLWFIGRFRDVYGLDHELKTHKTNVRVTLPYDFGNSGLVCPLRPVVFGSMYVVLKANG